MKNVLVLPGGGIRGYVQAAFLEEMEDLTGRTALDMFDMVVGTSTGGILAVALGVGRDPGDIVQMYRKHGPAIFKRPWWARFTNPKGLRAPKYDPEPLHEAIMSVVGLRSFRDTMVDTMVTTYNFTRARSKLLKSWRAGSGWWSADEACMATSAAPTYFPPFEWTGDLFVDGGVYANNPAALAATEAVKRWGVGNFRILVVNNGHEGSPGSDSSSGWGILGWAPHISDVFMDSGYDVQSYMAKKIAGAPRYLEVGPSGISVAMDDASPDAFVDMREAVDAMVVASARAAALFIS